MSKEIKECVHGIYWQTCAICKDKSQTEVDTEMENFGEGNLNKSKIKYDFSEIQEDLGSIEVDNAYDLEDSSDF